jgi:hypothetical protein
MIQAARFSVRLGNDTSEIQGVEYATMDFLGWDVLELPLS